MLTRSSPASGIELDMPSLRSFRYKGFPVKLSLMSSTPALERVDLDVSRESRHEYRVQQYYEPVSRILASFTGTRALKLRLRCIEDIVAGEKEALSVTAAVSLCSARFPTRSPALTKLRTIFSSLIESKTLRYHSSQ